MNRRRERRGLDKLLADLEASVGPPDPKLVEEARRAFKKAGG